MGQYQKGPLPKADRGNDPLRKAKYLKKNQPEYFYGMAIGVRHEFKVAYPSDQNFELTRDVIPYLA